jgi:Tol biopolymer transport system component
LVAATVVALLVAVGLLSWDLSEPFRTTAPAAAGQIAIPATGGINLVDSATGRSRQLLPSSANASVTALAWSPDRATLAYTLFHRRPEDRVSSAELFTIPAGGGTPTLVVPRPQPGTVVDAPSWSPDGQSIYYAFQGVENAQPVARVERVSTADGSRQVVYSDAAFPSASPDGRMLAFVYDDGNGQGLRVGSPEGGDAREIVPPSAFRGLAGPRFSPDGAWIAFVAIGPGPSGQRETRPTGLAALFGVAVAEAHGEPWGIWKVRPDGRGLQPVNSMQADEPLITWSRDGAWIAVHETGGLWIVDARAVGEPRRIADGTIGGIDW